MLCKPYFSESTPTVGLHPSPTRFPAASRSSLSYPAGVEQATSANVHSVWASFWLEGSATLAKGVFGYVHMWMGSLRPREESG